MTVGLGVGVGLGDADGLLLDGLLAVGVGLGSANPAEQPARATSRAAATTVGRRIDPPSGSAPVILPPK
jgi:hypothetical protein